MGENVFQRVDRSLRRSAFLLDSGVPVFSLRTDGAGGYTGVSLAFYIVINGWFLRRSHAFGLAEKISNKFS